MAPLTVVVEDVVNHPELLDPSLAGVIDRYLTIGWYRLRVLERPPGGPLPWGIFEVNEFLVAAFLGLN